MLCIIYYISQHLHDRYSVYVKEKKCEIYETKMVEGDMQIIEICPITGIKSLSHIPITVHAIMQRLKLKIGV